MGSGLVKSNIFSVCIFLSVATSAQAAQAGANLDKAGVILQGYDAVSYFKAKEPVRGDPKFQIKHEGATYYFADEADRSEFLRHLKKYTPQFGGWCAYAISDSKSKVDIDPKSFLIQDGRLLLFYNGLWGDTRKKWNRDPNTFLKGADANWPSVETTEP
jgi:YHS domain-containing protein